eukprot:SAG31_NODE_4005_length_3672_cov_2.293031_2_plen_145_part_00
MWVPTCANVCYMSDPTHRVYEFGEEVPCTKRCDREDREHVLDGWDIPPGGIRVGYNAQGEWCAGQFITALPKYEDLTMPVGRNYPMSIWMVENWCDRCVHAVTYNVDPLVMGSQIADSVLGMGPFGACFSRIWFMKVWTDSCLF